ncbi:hypothetical protein ACJQ40_002304 [Enterococcus faecium]|nr:hypothetical protein [Enterococcus faecium]
MKKKLVWLVFPLLVLTLAACSLGKSDKAFGYTYEEYVKVLENNIDSKEEILAVTKYEHNDQTHYLVSFTDDDIKSTSWFMLDEDYVEDHRTTETGKETREYFGFEEPAIDKVIEKYKVTDDHKFEKADSE